MRLTSRGPTDERVSCGTCGRWLIRIHRDGSFDINGQAAVSQTADLGELLRVGSVEAKTVPLSARCLRCHPPQS